MASTAKHDWPMVRLGDVCEISAGGTPKRSVPSYFNGEIPWVKIGDMEASPLVTCTEETITHLGLRESPAKLWPAGTILLSIFATVGRVAVLGVEAASNQAIAGLQVVDERVDRQYLVHYLRSLENELKHKGRGVAQNNVNLRLLRELEIPVPPLDEQRRIAAILDIVRDSLHTVQQQVQLLLQLPSLLLGELFKFSEKRRLDEIAMVGTGATPSRKNAAFYQGDIPWVKTTEVKGTIIVETEERISVDALENSNCKLNRAGSSVVAMYGQGATRGRVGYLGIEAATNQACAVVTPTDPSDDYFVYQCLSNSYVELRGLGRGGTQPNLNLSLVKDFQIPYPSAELRAKTSKDLRSMDNVIRDLRRRRDLLNELLESLSTRAFQGDL